MFKELDRRGLVSDYTFLDKLQRIVREATGVTAADEKLLEQADEMRRTRAVVKAEMASVSSNMPSGYSDNIAPPGTQPIFLQVPVELSLNQPLSPTINVPPPAETKAVISHGVDKYGEPTVEVNRVPVE